MKLFDTLTETEISEAALDPRELEELGIMVGPAYKPWTDEEKDALTPEAMGYDEEEMDDVEELRF
jgi:hypothetical protein